MTPIIYTINIKRSNLVKEIDVLKPLPILYVEDDEMLMSSTHKTLSVFFDNIATATNGIDAIKLVNERKFYLAILDIRIPHINGIEVAKEIRKNDKEMLIFITSSYQETHDLREALKLNMVDYLLKPFSFNELMQVLKECALRLIADGKLKRPIYGGVFYDVVKKCAIKDGVEIKLTKNEVKMLDLFFDKKGAVVNVEEIEYYVFPDSDEFKYGAIKNLISRLRKKLGEDAIVNIYEVGYYLRQEA